MSYLDRTHHIRKFGGTIYYVSKLGNDTNIGTDPDEALLTIGAAIDKLSVGDAIGIMAGTYTETGLDLDVNACEMWFEIGAILDPASGTALTISGNYCRVTCEGGALKITPATNATGVLVTGNFCYLSEIRVACFITDEATSADIGFDIGESGTTKGSGCDLRRCRVSSPDVVAFKIQADTVKLDNCCSGGGSDGTAFSSIGYWITNNADKTRLIYCGSQGHGTSGYQVDSGCTNGVIKDCNSGGGDGKWTDPDHAFVWSDFTFDDTIGHEIVLRTDDVIETGVSYYNCFKVTGAVRIMKMNCIIETAVTVSNLVNIGFRLASYNASAVLQDDENISAFGRDIATTTGFVGSVLEKNASATQNLDFISSHGVNVDASSTDRYYSFMCVEDADDPAFTTYIQVSHTENADVVGTLHAHIEWMPISDDGFISPV